jgi:Uma2 family endonuclease
MIATIVEEQKQMTAEEYLTLERKSLRENTGKYEFFNRKRKLMAGGTHSHNLAISNTVTTLNILSRQIQLNLQITSSDTKIISFLEYKNYMYPDIVVVEGKPFFEDEKQDIIVNPTLIIEVLSDSTEGFDRGDKFKSYRQIKSLKEYVLISSKRKSIEQFYCDENGRWQFGESITEGALKLYSLPLELQFDEVYLNVVFEATNENIVDDEKDKR